MAPDEYGEQFFEETKWNQVLRVWKDEEKEQFRNNEEEEKAQKMKELLCPRFGFLQQQHIASNRDKLLAEAIKVIPAMKADAAYKRQNSHAPHLKP